MSYINERTFLTGHLLLDPEATRNLKPKMTQNEWFKITDDWPSLTTFKD